MSLARKGLRRLPVDGQIYEWRIRRKATYSQGIESGNMLLAVQADTDKNSRTLLVADLGVSRPDNWMIPHQTSVTPDMVVNIIFKALEKGWKPLQKGNTFFLDYPIVKIP